MSLRGRGGKSRIQRGRGRPSGEKRENAQTEKKLTQRIYDTKNVKFQQKNRQKFPFIYILFIFFRI